MTYRNFAIAIPLVVFLIVWQFFAGSSAERMFFFSTPTQVWRVFWNDLLYGDLMKNILITGSEALLGFLIGNILGAILGISLWYSDTVAWISKPYISALGTLNIFAIASMTIIWFGTSFWAKVMLAFLATFFLAIGQAYRGVGQVDPLLLKRFRILRSSKATVFRHLLVPTGLVWIFSSLRITIGAALLGAFMGEVIVSDSGLAHMIVRASGLYDTSRVLVGVISMVAMAMVLDFIVSRVEKSVLRWKYLQLNK